MRLALAMAIILVAAGCSASGRIAESANEVRRLAESSRGRFDAGQVPNLLPGITQAFGTIQKLEQQPAALTVLQAISQQQRRGSRQHRKDDGFNEPHGTPLVTRK